LCAAGKHQQAKYCDGSFHLFAVKSGHRVFKSGGPEGTNRLD
jgi:hypothetical protein